MQEFKVGDATVGSAAANDGEIARVRWRRVRHVDGHRSSAFDDRRRQSRPVRAVLVPVVVVAGLALAACGGGDETSAPTTVTPAVAATVAPAATAAPVATAAPATTAPADTDGAAEATSCPAGYTEFDGVYPLRICHSGETVTALQQGLVDLGYDIVVDGLFGAQTQAALAEAFGDGTNEIATPADLEALLG